MYAARSVRCPRCETKLQDVMTFIETEMSPPEWIPAMKHEGLE